MTYPQSTRNCLHCGQPFTPKRPKQRWCNRSCAAKDYPRPTPDQRLSAKTDKNGPVSGDLGPCWLYTGSLVPDGYGTIFADGRITSAHRLAWELAYGPIPDGLFVLHKCDRRNCVNPAHLFLGTHQDNMRDMVAKDRAASDMLHGTHLHPESVNRGERNGGAKLTERQVRDIRQLRTQGVTREELAVQFGVSITAIQRIVQRRSWRHVA